MLSVFNIVFRNDAIVSQRQHAVIHDVDIRKQIHEIDAGADTGVEVEAKWGPKC